MTQNYTIVWSSDIKNNYNKIYKNKDDEIKMNLLLKIFSRIISLCFMNLQELFSDVSTVALKHSKTLQSSFQCFITFDFSVFSHNMRALSKIFFR